MKTRAVRIKLKPGSLKRVREWAAEVARRKDDALATLHDEALTACAARSLLAGA